MKRLLIITALAVTALTAAVVVAQQAPQTPPAESIVDIVQTAYGNELIALERYAAFAKTADEDGYKGVASLFRAAAKAERIHADRFAEVLKKKNETPLEPSFTPDVRSTQENLLQAVEAEREERDNVYLLDIQKAKALEEKSIATLFDLVRSAETEHANLCTIANATLDDQKSAKTYHVCSYCGYTTDVKLGRCPSCMHADARMTDVR